jgi:4-diphosphocytidyl-2-C-methyl-D-erythritol kinase
MICFPNCKINIGLFITRKRDDGYHDLETVFFPIPLRAASSAITTVPAHQDQQVLNDVLEVVPTQGPAKLHMSGLPVNGNIADNLVWKAYQLLQRDFGTKVPPLDIYLHKVVPMGAGLGGGSADGAYMLRLLNDFCKLGLSAQTLADYALQLGSDCPFFIYNTPQIAKGRGEIMQPIEIDLSAYDIRVVCPGVHVSTREAFSMITPRPAPFDLAELNKLPIAEWKNHVSNDFEASVFSIHPELALIKQRLYEQGAVYASMTGTGSAVYGIFGK